MPAKLLHVDDFEDYDYDLTMLINRSRIVYLSDDLVEQDDEVPPGETALVELENCSLARVQWPGQRPEVTHVNFEKIYI